MADLQIKISVDPDGPSGSAGFVTTDAVRLTAINIDIDVDSNNDGVIDTDNTLTGTDDPIEQNQPGHILLVTTGSDSLSEVKLNNPLASVSYAAAAGYSVQLIVDGRIQVYKDAERLEQLTTFSWTASAAIPSSLYIEGLAVGGFSMTWQLVMQSGTEPAQVIASDIVTGAIIQITPEDDVFYFKSEDAVDTNYAEPYKIKVYNITVNDQKNLGNATMNQLQIKILDPADNQWKSEVVLEHGSAKIENQQISYKQTNAWTKTEKLTYGYFSGAKLLGSGEGFITSGFKYAINDMKKRSDSTAQSLGGLGLAGGGFGDDDPPEPTEEVFSWFMNRVAGGDMLVMRGSETITNQDADNLVLTGYNALVQLSQQGVNTPLDSLEMLDFVYKVQIETSLRFSDPVNALARAMSEDWFVLSVIQKAEGIFFGGGDQSRYIDCWSGSSVATSIANNYETKNIVIGGSSAGMHILGDWDYSARFQGGGMDSANAQNDPNESVNPKITLDSSFIKPSLLANTMTDTHFQERNRMGRLVTLLANAYVRTDNFFSRGIAANENTALAILPDGTAKVLGATNIYFVKLTEAPTMDSNNPSLIGAALQIYNVIVKRVNSQDGLFSIEDIWSDDDETGFKYSLDYYGGYPSSSQNLEYPENQY